MEADEVDYVTPHNPQVAISPFQVAQIHKVCRKMLHLCAQYR